MARRLCDMTEAQRASIRESNRRYRERNAEKLAAYKAEWARTPRGKASLAASLEKYQKANPEKVAAARKLKQARYKARDPEAYAAIMARSKAKYRAKNKEKLLEANRQYYRKHHVVSAKRADEGMARALAAMPRSLPPQVRDDVLGDIMLALIDGTLKLDDVSQRVSNFVRAHNREYDTFKNVSLDAKHDVTGNAWIENLDSETEHF